MTADGPVTCVVDRIVDGTTAVVLLEEDGDVVDQLDVDVETLPEACRHEGALFDATISDGGIVDPEHRPERERERRDRLQERFDRLSKRLDEK
ncbi:DUF3006 family protein [Natronococcus occultus]|uniref:DUF3006 domain-containing protein n=1 Tax=Natronococcus occultus SP4 TaxID=694430 RepID=L0K4N5_9EURY|nr:DUF3006 family protein [Natronococcus occultus]AGB39981.1 Protein of unknown function (DUF3006) [Natronococcus occultus SP4]